MEDTFVLKIQLGNEAMQNALDVGEALKATGDKIMADKELHTGAYGYVIDINGNTVGSWEVQ